MLSFHQPLILDHAVQSGMSKCEKIKVLALQNILDDERLLAICLIGHLGFPSPVTDILIFPLRSHS